MSKRSNPIHNTVSFLIVAILFSFYGEAALAQSTAFTYQGRLTDGGGPATGQYDLQFQIFAALSGGTALGTVQLEDQPVTNGVFSVQLNFGAVNFNNNGAQFLEIGIRPGNQTGAYTPLTPRQQITSTPYAIKSLNAATADGLSLACVNCVTSSQIASAPAGSPSSYVQNTTTQQPTADFNISGNGTVGGTLLGNVLNATTQYNIGGNRVLSVAGNFNIFAGVGAGTANGTGSGNAYFGAFAGQANTTGGGNSFFGLSSGLNNNTGSANSFVGTYAGLSNLTGDSNSFVGYQAGNKNTAGNDNSFFGASAGLNTTGSSNSFVGREAGFSNLSGNFNSFFGQRAGYSNETAEYNSFFGFWAGLNNNTGAVNAFFGTGSGIANTTGNNNSFFGHDSGKTNTIGSNNTILGDSADVTANNLTNATAIGAGARVSSINTVVLGRNLDTVQIPGALSVTGATTFGGTLGAGIFNAATQYNIGSNRVLSVAGTSNTFAGINAGTANTSGNSNAFFGTLAGNLNLIGSANSFFGTSAGETNTTGGFNAFFGVRAGDSNMGGGENSFFGALAGRANTTGNRNTIIGSSANVASNNLTFATAIGAFAVVSSSNTVVLGRSADTVQIPGNLNVAQSFTGNFTVPAGNITGTVAIANGGTGSQTQNFVDLTNAQNILGNKTFTGTISGNGSGLTNLNGPSVTGTVANAANATTAGNVTGVVAVANGGTGSPTQNFVDLTNAQNILGNKTFAGTISGNGSGLTNLSGPSVTGTVANAANATTAGNVTGVVAVANGGTGSPTQNFVDLTNAQNILGNKTFSNTLSSNVVGIGTTSPLFKFHVKTGPDQDLVVRPGADFGSTGIGLQSINDVNTAYKPLDLEGSQVTLNVGSGGNVGIGTPAPEQKLHVDGNSEILSTGAGAGFKFRNRGSTSSADDWVWFSSGNIARFFRAGVGDLLTVQTGSNAFQTKYRFTGQVQVTTLYATGNAQPLIISSPDQNCWAITVNNAGQLGTSQITCP